MRQDRGARTFGHTVRGPDDDAAEAPVPAHDAADETCASDVDELHLVEGEEPALRLEEVKRDLRENELAGVERRVLRGATA